MEKIIEDFLNQLKTKRRKRFNLDTLEKHIISRCKGDSVYLEKGGYKKLYDQIMDLQTENKLRHIKSSDYNGLNPALKTRWEIIVEKERFNWKQSDMLKYSDYLDFNYYKNNPSYQTDMEWKYIENIYSFLKQRDSRVWESIEERSLELFYDEKFLTKNKNKRSKGILGRLRLTNLDLKMKKYGEMFIYWNKGTSDIEKIIIVENHSTFFTYKKMVEARGDVFGFKADVIIYGQGKKIENSFSFIEEIADISKIEVLYYGDIDSEGFGIYHRLKERYADIDIKLDVKSYIHLISLCRRDYPLGSQVKNLQYLNTFLEEMKRHLHENDIKKLKSIWDKDFRVPQELINYEYLLKVKK